MAGAGVETPLSVLLEENAALKVENEALRAEAERCGAKPVDISSKEQLLISKLETLKREREVLKTIRPIGDELNELKQANGKLAHEAAQLQQENEVLRTEKDKVQAEADAAAAEAAATAAAKRPSPLAWSSPAASMRPTPRRPPETPTIPPGTFQTPELEERAANISSAIEQGDPAALSTCDEEQRRELIAAMLKASLFKPMTPPSIRNVPRSAGATVGRTSQSVLKAFPPSETRPVTAPVPQPETRADPVAAPAVVADPVAPPAAAEPVAELAPAPAVEVAAAPVAAPAATEPIESPCPAIVASEPCPVAEAAPMAEVEAAGDTAPPMADLEKMKVEVPPEAPVNAAAPDGDLPVDVTPRIAEEAALQELPPQKHVAAEDAAPALAPAAPVAAVVPSPRPSADIQSPAVAPSGTWAERAKQIAEALQRGEAGALANCSEEDRKEIVAEMLRQNLRFGASAGGSDNLPKLPVADLGEPSPVADLGEPSPRDEQDDALRGALKGFAPVASAAGGHAVAPPVEGPSMVPGTADLEVGDDQASRELACREMLHQVLHAGQVQRAR